MLRQVTGRTTGQCSFCGKKLPEVRKLIAGPKGRFICDQCVELYGAMITEEAAETSDPDGTAS